MRIIESPCLTEQFRFPRSKKKRIRAKWAKRPENHRPDMKRVLQTPDGVLICHPKVARKLREQLSGFPSNAATIFD